MVAGKFRPRQVCGKSGLCLRAELSAERTVLSFMEQAPLGGLFRLCWAMSGRSVFDGVRRVGLVSKLLKNYSLETETDWQLWAVEGFGIPGETSYL